MRNLVFLIFTALLIVSCGSKDYRNIIPANSPLVASVNLANKNAAEDLSFLTHYLKMDDPLNCGIDITQKIFLFETADGNFGLCAKVSSSMSLDAYRQRLVKERLLSKHVTREDIQMAVIADKFIAAWNDDVFVILGPVLPSGQKDMMAQIATYFNQDEEESIVGTKLMDKLENEEGPISIVAQVSALPQQVASILTIGAPKDLDISEICFSAGLDIHDDMLVIESEPFSTNKAADEYIKKSYGIFRQIGDTYIKNMDKHDFAGLFLNVDGKKFLPLMQKTPALQSMLMGVNQAIDLNAIVKSINGDMYIGMPRLDDSRPSLVMAAKLGQSEFLKDVAYWKSSVPEGMQITDWKKDAYSLHGNDVSLYFGVQNWAPLQFYAGTDQQLASSALSASDNPVDDAVLTSVKGHRLALVMSLASLLPSDGGIATMMLPSMMKAHYILYLVK